VLKTEKKKEGMPRLGMSMQVKEKEEGKGRKKEEGVRTGLSKNEL